MCKIIAIANQKGGVGYEKWECKIKCVSLEMQQI